MKVFHVPGGVPYHVENSIRGIRTAKRQGYGGIDLDLQMTLDNRVVGTHWPRPLRHGFKDPQRRLRRDTPVRQMTLLEVKRLKARYRLRTYRIQTIERLLAECARQNIVAVLEPKDDDRFENPEVWQHIRKVADDLGAEVTGYSITNLGGDDAGSRRVKAMKAAGIPAHTIH